jgi:type IV pilus assembly protein PilC
MPWFRVRVSDSRGKVREITREAHTEETLLRDLTHEGQFPIGVAREDEKAGPAGSRVRDCVVIEFTEVLAELLSAGLSLKDALDVASHCLERGQAGRLTLELRESVEKGVSLSTALDGHGRGFSRLYTGLIRVGERTGNLDVVVPQLAAYLKARKSLKDKIASAATYPIVVIVVAILAMVVVSLVVIPSVQAMSDELGVATPQQLLIALDRAGRLASGFWIIALVVACLVGGTALLRRSERTGIVVDRVLLTIPLIGPYLRHTQMAQLMFAMEALTASGIAVEDAIEQARLVVTNKAIARDLEKVRERLNQGIPFSEAFAPAETIPARVKAWTRIGENTGRVAGVFAEMRSYYDRAIERMAARITALVEPAMIVALGAVILLVVIRIVVPLFGAMRSIV